MPSRRVLLILQDPPLPLGRAMGRWYYALLRGLTERGHRVRAFATCSSEEEAERARALFPPPEFDLECYLPDAQRSPWDRLRTLRWPMSYPFSRSLRRDLAAAAAEGFDVLHLEVLWSGYVGRRWASKSVVGVPFLYGIDLADQPAGSVQDRLLRRAIFRAERDLARAFPRHIAVSPRLAKELARIAPAAEVHAVPFAMDLGLYPFREAVPPDRPPTLGFVASFNWTPGVTAGHRLLGRLWPEIQRRVPEARVLLGGVNALQSLAQYVGIPGVEIRDRVDDGRAFFEEIDIQVYPPNPSSGMKFKVLEAFALGVPVVTNAAGVEGIPAEDGVHAGICEDDAGLIDRTVALLRNPAERDRLRLAARSLIEAHCSPGPVLDRIEQIHEAVAEGRPAPGRLFDPGRG